MKRGGLSLKNMPVALLLLRTVPIKGPCSSSAACLSSHCRLPPSLPSPVERRELRPSVGLPPSLSLASFTAESVIAALRSSIKWLFWLLLRPSRLRPSAPSPMSGQGEGAPWLSHWLSLRHNSKKISEILYVADSPMVIEFWLGHPVHVLSTRSPLLLRSPPCHRLRPSLRVTIWCTPEHRDIWHGAPKKAR